MKRLLTRRRLLSAPLVAASVLAGVTFSLSGQQFNQAAARAKSDLDKALTEFGATENRVAQEKVALLKDVDALDTQVREASRELRELEKEESLRERNFASLKREADARTAEVGFLARLLDEFHRGFPQRSHFSENQLYDEQRKVMDDRLEAGELSPKEELEERMKAIHLSVDRVEEVLGGRVFPGEGLSEDGQLKKGHFALLGPVSYFASEDGSFGGVTSLAANQARPPVVDLGGGMAASIGKLIRDGEAEVPIDPTLGKALRIAASKDSITEHLKKGGVVGYAIVALGLLAVIIAISKYFEISRFAVPTLSQIDSVVEDLMAGDREKAEATARSVPGIGGELMQVGVEQFGTKRRIMEELFYEKLISVRPRLDRLLPFLAVTAAAAPLMGLLGTVVGMIKTFALITEFGTGDARSLSSGISEALVTTELGLVVAIPILVIHGILVRMSRGKVGRMESAAMAFLNSFSRREVQQAA